MGVLFLDEDLGDFAKWEIREVGVVPPPVLTNVVRLKNAGSGRCVANPRFDEVTAVPCVATARAQRWKAETDDLGHFKITNAATGRVLMVTSTGVLATHPYWGFTLAQKWESPAA